MKAELFAFLFFGLLGGGDGGWSGLIVADGGGGIGMGAGFTCDSLEEL